MLTTLRSERDKHHEDDPVAMTADGNLAAQPRRDENRTFKERFVQISKIHRVTCKVGQALRFIPHDSSI